MIYLTTLSNKGNEPQDFGAALLHLYGLGPAPAPLAPRNEDAFRHTYTKCYARDHLSYPRRWFDNLNILILLIRDFVNSHPDQEQWYTTFHIPKKSGGLRRIDAPIDELKILQREIVNRLTHDPEKGWAKFVHAHDTAYAYIENRSVRDALVQHQRNDSHWFLKLDIQNFFPSCTTDKLRLLLSQVYPFCFIPVPYLTEILEVCTWHGALPQGAVTSPMLSNMMMVPIDKAINDEIYNLNRHHYVYTRYADDILISAREGFNWQEMSATIGNILNAFGFQLKTEKTRYGSRAGRNWNLGIMLNKDNALSLGHVKKQQLRAMLHNFLKDFQNGIRWSIEDTRTLVGQLSYLQQIEPEYQRQIIHRLETKLNINYRTTVRAILNP